MAKASVLSVTQAHAQGIVYPYAPSWFDRFKVWVERLPGPPWLFYLLVGTVLFAALTLVEWQAGGYPVGTVNVFHLWFAIEIPYTLAAMHYLDRVALNALTTSKPTLNVDAEHYELLRYQLTTLPTRPTLLTSLALGLLVPVFILLGILFFPDTLQVIQGSTQPAAIAFFLFLFALTWWCFGTLIVHTIHQLRLVSRIYREDVSVNLFDLGPLYAFSGLTARTAVAFLIMVYMWSATNNEAPDQPISDTNGIAFALLALVTFALPLWGIHTRIATEKQRMLGENGRRSEALVNELNEKADTGDLSRATMIKDAVTTLDLQHKSLEKIPTWPWQPDTLRTVITAVLIPIVLFILQFFIQRVLGTK